MFMMFWLVRVKLQLNGGLVQRFLSKAALFALFVSLPFVGGHGMLPVGGQKPAR
jgi:hypothetical protein